MGIKLRPASDGALLRKKYMFNTTMASCKFPKRVLAQPSTLPATGLHGKNVDLPVRHLPVRQAVRAVRIIANVRNRPRGTLSLESVRLRDTASAVVGAWMGVRGGERDTSEPKWGHDITNGPKGDFEQASQYQESCQTLMAVSGGQ